MNKIFTSLILLAALSFGLNAQTLSFSSDSYSGWGEQDESFVYVKGTMTYENPGSNKALAVNWVATPTLPDGWTIGICDDVNCFDALQSIPDLTNFSLDPGETKEVKIQFRPDNISGEGSVDLTLSGDDVANVTSTFTLNAVPTDLEDIAEQNISIYPNPAIDKLNVDVSGYDLSGVRIYNLIGKEVLFFEVELQNEYELEFNVSDLNQGMYLISLEDETGSAIETRRFSKVY